MTILIFIFVAAFAGTFLAVASIVAMHFFRYGAPGDRSKVLGGTLLGGSFVFLALTLITFFATPWPLILEALREISQ